jgi:hypothetical protein
MYKRLVMLGSVLDIVALRISIHYILLMKRYHLTTGKARTTRSTLSDPCQHKLLRFLRPKDSFVALPVLLQTHSVTVRNGILR